VDFVPSLKEEFFRRKSLRQPPDINDNVDSMTIASDIEIRASS
jgi:hypothetical protein